MPKDACDDVVVEEYVKLSGGKDVGATKMRYSWMVSIGPQTCTIQFNDSKTSGMKRVFVDDQLKCARTVFPSPVFKYRFRYAGHQFAIVPKKIDQRQDSLTASMKNAFNKMVDCEFTLLIDGLPFQAYQRGGLLLYVKTVVGETMALDVKETDTIAAIKSKIEEEHGIEAARQMLIHEGKQLRDARILSFYKFMNGVTLHLVLSPQRNIPSNRTPSLTSEGVDTTPKLDNHQSLQNRSTSASSIPHQECSRSSSSSTITPKLDNHQNLQSRSTSANSIPHQECSRSSSSSTIHVRNEFEADDETRLKGVAVTDRKDSRQTNSAAWPQWPSNTKESSSWGCNPWPSTASANVSGSQKIPNSVGGDNAPWPSFNQQVTTVCATTDSHKNSWPSASAWPTEAWPTTSFDGSWPVARA